MGVVDATMTIGLALSSSGGFEHISCDNVCLYGGMTRFSISCCVVLALYTLCEQAGMPRATDSVGTQHKQSSEARGRWSSPRHLNGPLPTHACTTKMRKQTTWFCQHADLKMLWRKFRYITLSIFKHLICY